jgi:protein SCO1
MSIFFSATGRPSRRLRGRISLPASLIVLLLFGCSPRDGDDQPGYPLRGEILEVHGDRNVLVVRHEEIPGYMPAMTMEFSVSEGDLANAAPGQNIRARLIESDGRFRLERIWPVDPMAEGIVDRTGRALRQDTVIRGSKVFREVGEPVPAFALFDQNGQVVQVDRFRGRRIALNFIYTRCPVPEMCPAATQRMIQLQEAAREAGIENFELISISLDPEYDTPGVLRQYAESYRIDTSNFSLLTGPERAVADLMDQMGILVNRAEGLSSHTLGTILVDEGGVIRHRVFGSNWMVNDFLQRLKELQSESE